MIGIFDREHPTNLELIGLLDGDGGDALSRGAAVAEHVAECRTCLAQLLTAAEAPADAGAYVGRKDELTRARLPDRLLIAMSQQPPDHVEVGQLWRLTWDELFVLAIVVGADPIRATMAAVGYVPTAEGDAILADSDASPLGIPLGVDTRSLTVVSLAALGQYLGALTVDVVTVAPVGAATGLAETLRQLGERSLSWIPSTDRGASDVASSASTLSAHGIDFDRLANTVGDEAALALWRGDRPATAAESAALEDLGVPPSGVPTQRNVPPKLLQLVADVTYKESARAAAARRGTGEADVRARLVQAALAPAARTTGASRRTPQMDRWRAIIEHELQR